tara:strand:- start:133 stop:336 length:204 start_codon:yes stop_codon:yes gene_type:complete
MKTWAKGWRVVLKCNECEVRIWAKNIGQTVKCDCDVPNYLVDNPNYYNDGGKRGSYKLSIEQVAEPY